MGAACGSGMQRVAPGRVVVRWLAPERLAPERLAPGCSAGTEVRR